MIIHFTKNELSMTFNTLDYIHRLITNELSMTFNTLDYIHRLITKGKLEAENMPKDLILKWQIGLSEMVDALVIVKRLLNKLEEDFT